MRNLRKAVSAVLTLAIIVSMLVGITVSAEPVTLADGTYTIDVQAWNATQDKASAMAPVLDSQAVIVVENGEITAAVKFIEGIVMTIPVDGSAVSEVWPEPESAPEQGTGLTGDYNDEDKSQTYTFPLSTLDMPKLSMYVTVMSSIQTIRLKFDMDSIEPVEEPFSIEDGKYTIGVSAWHETKDEASMMASLLDATAILEVENGEITATITFIDGTIMGQPVSASSITEVWPEFETKPTTDDRGSGVNGVTDTGSNAFTFTLSTLDMPKLAMDRGSISVIRLNFDLASIEEYETPFSIADGQYTIGVRAWHATNDNASSANNYLVKTALLTVADGIYTVSVTFVGYNGSPSISEVWPEPDETPTAGSGLSGVENPDGSATYTFPVSTLDMPKMSVYIAPMPMMNIQSIRLNFDLNTIEPVTVYTIGVRAWHETNDTASMMASLLDATAVLEIKDGKITARITFIDGKIYGASVAASSITEVWPEFEVKPTTSDRGTGITGVGGDGTNSFTFELSTLDMPKLAMDSGNISTVRLKFDSESLTPYKGIFVSGAMDGTVEANTVYTAKYAGGGTFVKGAMIAAEYDADGKLLNTSIGTANEFSMDFSASNVETAKVKIMLWSDFSGIGPLSKVAVYQVK